MPRKLTVEQVKAIRTEYATGTVSQKVLAWKYRVTPANIHSIVHRRSWRKV